ncbi:C40 family peptidase [Bacillus sp. BRMEA1]|nr:C40 family peptidase [Neobacillus endophyticus]
MDSDINVIQNEETLLERQLSKLKLAIIENEKKVQETDAQLANAEGEIHDLQLNIDSYKSKLGIQSMNLNIDSLTPVLSLENEGTPDTLSSYEATKRLFENTSELNNLISVNDTLEEKIKNANSLKEDLAGMSELLTDQAKEKNDLLNDLETEETTAKKNRDSLFNESQTLTKHKSEIERAIQNEQDRLDGNWSTQPTESYTPTINLAPGEVPQQLMKYYLYAEQKYGVPWYYLAAINKIETNFNTDSTMVSTVGAIGPMQFLPATWVGQKYSTGGGLVDPNLDITNLQTIKAGNGYGVDADNDGMANPWDIADSIATAANYLSANGFATDIRKAIWHYNHADWYVDEVIALAETYKNNSAPTSSAAIQLNAGKENDVVTVGYRWINNSVYVFGGGRNQSDIQQGIFDCSSFVHWAFAQIGINLGELSSVSTDTLKAMGEPVNESDIRPGDLVFFDTYKKDGHVGIYIGNGKFIGAQSSTGVAIADMTTGYWKEKFNHRVIRILK